MNERKEEGKTNNYIYKQRQQQQQQHQEVFFYNQSIAITINQSNLKHHQ